MASTPKTVSPRQIAAAMGGFTSSLWGAPPKTTRRASIEEVAEVLAASTNVVALTGAGMSRESGIPTFRDPSDGLWRRYDPATYATIWGFDRSPNKIWELIRDFLEETSPAPNRGHTALADLEADGLVTCVVTCNVDNLHQESGSKQVVEYHGSLMQSACRSCRAPGGPVVSHLAQKALPPRCTQCGGPLKPSAVLFGERIPPRAAREAADAVAKCDVLLVIGTSATVRPAADLPRIAAERGATVIEVNVECSCLTDKVSDMILLGKAGEALPKVVDAVRRRRVHGGRSAPSRPAADAARPGHSMLRALR